MDAGDTKINEIWCLTARVHRLVKETGEQVEMCCKPQEREMQSDLHGMLYILGYSVIRRRASNKKDDLSRGPMAWSTKPALKETSALKISAHNH